MVNIKSTVPGRSCPPQMSVSRIYAKLQRKMQPCLTHVSRPMDMPSKKSSVPLDVKPYLNVQYAINEEQLLLYERERLLVPTGLRHDMLARLHERHAGIEKFRLCAKAVFYWPNMNKDIETHISKCPVCATYSRANQAEPMIEHDIPNHPWSKVSSGVLEFGGRRFLIVVDYYSVSWSLSSL